MLISPENEDSISGIPIHILHFLEKEPLAGRNEINCELCDVHDYP